MKLSEIPDEVVNALREYGYSDAMISKMKPVELFDVYCNHEGLINYGRSLWRIMTILKKASK